MPEWNNQENFISYNGFFTIYSPSYDDELRDSVESFNCSGPKPGQIGYLRRLEDYLEASLANVMDAGDEEEYDLIGINSNSFTEDRQHHNIFLEWDKGHHLPDMEALRTLGGTIVETNDGLKDNPGLLNDDPYGAGWIAVVEGDNLDADLATLQGADGLAEWAAKEVAEKKELKGE